MLASRISCKRTRSQASCNFCCHHQVQAASRRVQRHILHAVDQSTVAIVAPIPENSSPTPQPTSISPVETEQQIEVLPRVRSSTMLARLLDAEDPEKCCKENIDSLTEEFFEFAATYSKLVVKDNADEAARLKTVIKIAWVELQKTLRPEVQLINRLLTIKDRDDRKQELQRPVVKKVLQMNGGYFFTLLDKMIADIQWDLFNIRKGTILRTLKDIRTDAIDARKMK